MRALIDMASSPQYLAHSAHSQMDTNDGSCATGHPDTVSAYPDPDEIYTSVSAFDQPTVVDDDNLLTPVSSAASPPLHQRSKVQSPYHQPQESPCPQQPTPPNTSTMYPYPDFLTSTSQASSPMAVPATVSQAPHHDILGPYNIHNSPGHEDSIPPPQPNPYFGHYSASSVSVGPDPDGLPSYYLQNAINENSYGLLRGSSLPDIGSGSYTHRPLAPNLLQHTQPGPYRRDVVPISRLSPSNYGRPPPLQLKRHSSRKPSARKARVKKEQSSSPPMVSQPFRVDEAGRSGDTTRLPEDEVDLDHKTPADLRRLWNIRQNWYGKRGHGMWDNIIKDFLGPEEADALSEDKKTQVKANLQMKIHRGVLRHGSWPQRDKAALLRAYVRWEENRYNEIFRMFMEELQSEGREPAYEWKSIHVEAELVKEGLEQKQREPSKARRRRVQVPARHSARAAAGLGPAHAKASSIQHPAPQQQRLPAMFDLATGFSHYPSQHYAQQQHPYGIGHRREMSANSSSYDMLVEQLNAQPQPLTDEQHEQLIDECLERASFEASPEPGLAALEQHNNQRHDDDIKMSEDPYPEDQLPRSRPSSSSLPAINGMIASASVSPDINTQRSTAMARQACGELLKQSGPSQHSSHHQYAGV
ncbi:hypothetical protein J7T55_003242 [Diaporthe amygdali]|uniref:uncharacterized protein n=1 Tax=Phomopsis amygdali TaxID=1214568 RepID=UPI0022FDE941|nr:uncharacterized protein J7T55_003242 [Diaporthe amygdali]KAJ0122726.1 hypothetical protein J7T55_003242 [Diaporthe amygdali]